MHRYQQGNKSIDTNKENENIEQVPNEIIPGKNSTNFTNNDANAHNNFDFQL